MDTVRHRLAQPLHPPFLAVDLSPPAPAGGTASVLPREMPSRSDTLRPAREAPSTTAPVLPPLGALEILAAGPEAFLFLDGDFRVRYANPGAERLFGRSAESLYGRRPWEGWPSAIGAAAEAHYRRAMTEQGHVTFRDQAERSTAPVHLEVNAYAAAGGLAVFVRDITEPQQQLEEARQAALAVWQDQLELENRNRDLVRENVRRTDAERDSATARQLMVMVLDSIADGVAWFDAEWRCRFVNGTAAALLDATGGSGAYRGRVLWEAIPALAGSATEHAMRSALTEGRVTEHAHQVLDGDRWLEHRIVPLADGTVLLFSRDATAARRQLDALRASEARYRALVDAATQMVWSTDPNGQVVDMPFWRELTGQTLEEVRGAGWVSAIHPEDAPATMRRFQEAVTSRSAYEAQYRLRLRDGSYRWYRARGVPVLGPDGAVREWVGLFNEVDRMIRRDEAMQFLVDAGAALAETLEEKATLDTLARLAVDQLADGAMITLVREGGRLEHVTTRSRDGHTAAFAAETERLYPLPSDASSGYPRAIRTGEPELIPPGAFHEDILPRLAADATHLERLRRLEMYSGMVVPLVARGHIIGAMTLVLQGRERRRPFDAADLALATELGRRAALALENARLFDAERHARDSAERSAELTRRLQEITAAFARTISVQEVAKTTLSQGLDALSAESGLVYLMNPDGDALELVHQVGITGDVASAFGRVPLDAEVPVADAVREGEIVYLAERSELRRRYPWAAERIRTLTADAWAAVPLLHGGRTLGVISVGFTGAHEFSAAERALLDALGRHCAQAMERARLLDAEREARDEAERANRAKSDLLAKVSHETRQPVHASIGWANTLEMELHGPVTEAQQEALRRIKQNQLRLLTVLNDLLDISRIEAGKLDLDVRVLRVADIVDAVESAVAPQLRDRALDLHFPRPSPDVVVRADADQLVGILTNLLGNAAKFTPAGGEVTVRCERGEGIVRIQVRDTGIGIAPALHDRIFEPFFQVESGFTRTTVGTGLGLSISREAARAMGGDVTLESAPGAGSTFTVTLPAG
ncbi:MAG: domain S-box [Gemmatimonadetes bacterium]|nr:domain S-box [Gemmatimonadota bacterium]